MGFLDYLGDAAKGGADAMLADMERRAQEKHDMAMADKALERDAQQGFLANSRAKKLAKIQAEADAVEADARRKAEREEKDAGRKWEREKLELTEAGRNQRHRESMARQPAPATQAKPPRMEFREVPRSDGSGIDIVGFDPITGEEVMRNGRRRDTSAPPASVDEFLSRY
jgi:hypothetical protein